MIGRALRPLPQLLAGPKAAPIAPAQARTIEYCTFCPKMCRHACPVAVAEGSEAATPAWKAGLADLWMRGALPLEGAVAAAAYRCTDCRLATTACKHGIAPPDHLQAVREAAFRAGVAPEAARSWAARIARLGNPHAADLPERLAALVPAGRLAPDGSAGPVLFPGCTTVRHAPRAVADALALLDRSALPGEAPVRVAARGAGCCGLPLLLAGDAAGFRDLATRVHGALRGAGRVISLDPGCVHAFETLYAGIGLQDLAGKARTLVESLFERERLARLETAVVRRLPTPPAYHDPCYLGRYRGVYDAPRALLAAATEGRAPPLELTTSREHAFCAGTGGIYGKVFPHGARRVLARRLGEVEGRGRLATACPSCVRGLEKNVDARIAPVDVTTVLAWAVGARDDGVNRERSC